MAFLQRSSKRRRQRSEGARRSKRECMTALDEQKNVNVRKWLKGQGKPQLHLYGTDHPRSQRSGQTILKSSQRKSQSRKGHPGCSSRRSWNLYLGEMCQSQGPKRKLHHHWLKSGKSLQKSTGPRASGGSAVRQPKIDVAGPDHQGGRAVPVGASPRTTEGILHTITEVQSLVDTDGIVPSLQQGPLPVPRQPQVQAMVLSRRQNQRNGKRSLLCWKNWASAKTLCNRSATTVLRARRSQRAAQTRAQLPEGHLVISLEELDAGGVAADEVAQRRPLVPGPRRHRKDVDHGQALHVAGLTGAHRLGSVMGTGGA